MVSITSVSINQSLSTTSSKTTITDSADTSKTDSTSSTAAGSSATSAATDTSKVAAGGAPASSGSSTSSSSESDAVKALRKQIADGGPLTVTDPNVTRYFMTIPEASRLVLQAGALAEGGEVFVLDMGEPIRVLDLARDLILLSGLKKGEKLHEALLQALQSSSSSTSGSLVSTSA